MLQKMKFLNAGCARRNVRESIIMYQRVCLILLVWLCSCSETRYLSKQAKQLVLSDTATRGAHVGISIFDPATGKVLYEHQSDKYFVPASNTKLFSLYAGLKFIGDTLPGIGYHEK